MAYSGKGKEGVSEIIFTLLAINTPLADSGKGGGVRNYIHVISNQYTTGRLREKVGGGGVVRFYNLIIQWQTWEGGSDLNPEFYKVLKVHTLNPILCVCVCVWGGGGVRNRSCAPLPKKGVPGSAIEGI